MKLEKYRDDSYEFSKQASDLIRQFAFAGIAVIWIFKVENSEKAPMIPEVLICPLLLFITTLIFDLFQYLIPTIIWSLFYRIKEKKTKDDADVKASGWLSMPGWLFWILKVASLLFAYYYLISFMIRKIQTNG